jgi:hypothetical protein
MSPSAIVLHGFAYGEDLDAFGQRSLGYHLLAPAGGTAWGHEIEALARRLQAAPYPDEWPTADLFCSVVLTHGQRVVAVARYGLTDHSHDQRRGGLELIGVVTEGKLSSRQALAVYHWLQSRRASTDDLHSLGGQIRLAEILVTAPALAQPAGEWAAVPASLWQDGTHLFGAASPGDPDHYLHLLEFSRCASWQWLPLVGSDYPFQHQARHGPLLAWIPHLPGARAEASDGPRPLHLVAMYHLVEEHSARP